MSAGLPLPTFIRKKGGALIWGRCVLNQTKMVPFISHAYFMFQEPDSPPHCSYYINDILPQCLFHVPWYYFLPLCLAVYYIKYPYILGLPIFGFVLFQDAAYCLSGTGHSLLLNNATLGFVPLSLRGPTHTLNADHDTQLFDGELQ